MIDFIISASVSLNLCVNLIALKQNLKTLVSLLSVFIIKEVVMKLVGVYRHWNEIPFEYENNEDFIIKKHEACVCSQEVPCELFPACPGKYYEVFEKDE